MPRRFTSHCERQPVTRRPAGYYTAHEAEILTTLRKSARYAKARAGTFPSTVRLSEQAVGYRCEELNAWLDDPTGWRAPVDPAEAA